MVSIIFKTYFDKLVLTKIASDVRVIINMEHNVVFRLKNKCKKSLKADIFPKLTKLKWAIKTSKNPKAARANFEREFIATCTKLVRKENASESYVFINQFIDEYKTFSFELKIQAEIVLKKGNMSIIGDLYRTMPWTDARYFFKAKKGEQIGEIGSTYSIIDGLLKKNKKIFEKDYAVIAKYVLENGNDHECYVVAKVSNGEILFKLEDRFLKLNNNVFDIKDFALLNNINEEKFISKLLEYDAIKDANKVLEKKINIILGKVEKNKHLAEMYIDFCIKCGRQDLIKSIKNVQKTEKILKKSKLDAKDTNILKEDDFSL